MQALEGGEESRRWLKVQAVVDLLVQLELGLGLQVGLQLGVEVEVEIKAGPVNLERGSSCCRKFRSSPD